MTPAPDACSEHRRAHEQNGRRRPRRLHPRPRVVASEQVNTRLSVSPTPDRRADAVKLLLNPDAHIPPDMCAYCTVPAHQSGDDEEAETDTSSVAVGGGPKAVRVGTVTQIVQKFVEGFEIIFDGDESSACVPCGCLIVERMIEACFWGAMLFALVCLSVGCAQTSYRVQYMIKRLVAVVSNALSAQTGCPGQRPHELLNESRLACCE